MTRRELAQPGATTEAIIERLTASENVCDNRRGADLQELLTLSRGPWRERFEILRFASMEEGALAVVCRLSVTGLVCRDGQPVRHGAFVCALGIPNSYPLAPPTVQFLGTIPWCGHVVHKDFLPEVSQLPPFLQEYLRQGHGRCCYVRSSQWRADVGTLAIALWQVSRLVSFDKTRGEVASLNPMARDYARRLAEDGGSVPLGPPLPYPRVDDLEQVGATAVAETPRTVEGDDVEWLPKETEGQPDAS